MSLLEHDLFISYNWNIEKQVDLLQENLESKCGFKVWRALKSFNVLRVLR